jgi:hypothetical protein
VVAEESSLRDRVVFVEGAPRSGTTLLAALIATHPDVAGITAESHLFDRGVGVLLENHEETGPWRTALRAYISRDELLVLTRALCDGVLGAMRARVNPGARYVVEKTPAPRGDAATVLAHKLEVYPDAAYVHIVREAEAAARSLARAPFTGDRSRAGARSHREQAVSAIRSVLGPARHYREVSYEGLVERPSETIAELFAWIGLDADQETMRRVSLRAKERFADFTPAQLATPAEESSGRRRTRSVLRHLRAAVRRRTSPPGPPDARGATGGREPEIADRFALALRTRDRSAIAELTTEDFAFSVISGAGDRRANGPEARKLLHQVAERIFERPLQSETWSVHDGGDVATVLWSAYRADGYRLDFSLSLGVRGARVAKAGLVSPGELGGRPLQTLEL